MKKYLAILCVMTLLVASFTACSGRDVDGEASGSASSTGVGEQSGPAIPTVNEVRTFTVEEAKKHNLSLSPSDIRLIQFEAPKTGSPIATIETSAGSITLVLYPEQAPKAVENFVTHAKNGYYNGMSFSRVIKDFIIQSGTPDEGQPVSTFEDDDGNALQFESEFSLDLWNFRGALVMRNLGAHRPDSNTSEFFIVQADLVNAETMEILAEAGWPQKVRDKYAEVGGIPGFDWRNTVFGMVTEGMDVVDAIAVGETDAANHPVEPVVISKITIKD